MGLGGDPNPNRKSGTNDRVKAVCKVCRHGITESELPTCPWVCQPHMVGLVHAGCAPTRGEAS